jgi:hypothetical protein
MFPALWTGSSYLVFEKLNYRAATWAGFFKNGLKAPFFCVIS